MGRANLSIGSEISRIENSARQLDKSDPATSEALRAIVSSLKKIEEAMDQIAYKIVTRS